ncbi:hypothetical protein KSC_013060 [Ktedonobacter sp. SOSP1-52]|uniref:potassium channel family protein n=1 Tax=Ktedonobacter sp. SOSP1-52 TaxID=2778366 RepID=UPI001915BB16|nr:potassium channel family protein [Ktedonobacter sp. SOSP1-52]GHO62414.1 hypothetical protein KSC_013060 [Ktedonobacter sp. SOSP1-52]
MKPGDPPEGALSESSIWMKIRHPHITLVGNYGLVLVFIVLSISIIAGSANHFWVIALSVLLTSITLLLALWASGSGQRTMYFGLGALTISVATVFVQAIIRGEQYLWLPETIDMLLIMITPIVIARHLFLRHIINMQTLLGALCIYLLIGLFFGCLYTVFDFLIPVSVFTTIVKPTISDYLYFSFVTLTTLGYGDLAPEGGFARSLVVIEALSGQLYLVTVIALLISYISGKQSDKHP